MTVKEYMTADLPVFFNPEELGTSAVVTPIGGGDSYTANVQKFEVPNDYGDAFYTYVTGQQSDFVGITKNDTMIIDGITFAVVSFKIDEFNNTIEVFLNE